MCRLPQGRRQRGHAFARTLEEHNGNVNAWRRIEAQRALEAEAAAEGEAVVE